MRVAQRAPLYRVILFEVYVCGTPKNATISPVFMRRNIWARITYRRNAIKIAPLKNITAVSRVCHLTIYFLHT